MPPWTCIYTANHPRHTRTVSTQWHTQTDLAGISSKLSMPQMVPASLHACIGTVAFKNGTRVISTLCLAWPGFTVKRIFEQ